jgi:hypothetical protein
LMLYLQKRIACPLSLKAIAMGSKYISGRIAAPTQHLRSSSLGRRAARSSESLCQIL